MINKFEWRKFIEKIISELNVSKAIQVLLRAYESIMEDLKEDINT